MKKLCVFPNDPIYRYYGKGEIKPRYYNPCNFFDEVHIITLCEQDVEPEKVQTLVGDARLVIHPIGRPTPLSFPFYFRRACNLVRAIRPQVIRGYDLGPASVLATHCGRQLKIPLVISLHGDQEECRKFPFKYGWKSFLRTPTIFINILPRAASSLLFERYCLGNAAKVICVTKFLTQYAQKYGSRDIQVIYNRVSTRKFQPRQRNDRERKMILCIGRVGFQKNQECLIRSIVGLNVDLLLVGEPDRGDLAFYNRLKSLAQNLGVGDRVHFIKSIPYEKIEQIYVDADIFAIATRWEGFCIPVLEAMAAKLPVVVADKEPLPEVLGGTGIVVQNTPEAFQAAFRRLIANPNLSKELGEKGRDRAKELDGAVMEEKEMQLYQALTMKTG